jgi:large subunit ribosomal protein L24
MGGLHVRKHDLVVVRTGKDRGKTGKVLKVIPETGRAVVERVNFVKHFVKPDRSKNVAGGIMEKESPLPLARLMLYCETCAQGVRARTKRLEDGSKTRICPKCETSFETRK